MSDPRTIRERIMRGLQETLSLIQAEGVMKSKFSNSGSAPSHRVDFASLESPRKYVLIGTATGLRYIDMTDHRFFPVSGISVEVPRFGLTTNPSSYADADTVRFSRDIRTEAGDTADIIAAKSAGKRVVVSVYSSDPADPTQDATGSYSAALTGFLVSLSTSIDVFQFGDTISRIPDASAMQTQFTAWKALTDAILVGADYAGPGIDNVADLAKFYGLIDEDATGDAADFISWLEWSNPLDVLDWRFDDVADAEELRACLFLVPAFSTTANACFSLYGPTPTAYEPVRLDKETFLTEAFELLWGYEFIDVLWNNDRAFSTSDSEIERQFNSCVSGIGIAFHGPYRSADCGTVSGSGYTAVGAHGLEVDLDGITEGDIHRIAIGPYYTNVAHAVRYKTPPQIEDTLPAVNLWDIKEDYELLPHDQVSKDLAIFVELWVRHISATESAELLSTVAADLEHILLQDYTRGGLAVDTQVESNDVTVNESDTLIGVTMPISINFRHRYGKPHLQ
jgi:hypothetical protein